MLDLKYLDDVSATAPELRPAEPEPECDALDVESIAALPVSVVERMTREELIRVIRAARLPQLNLAKFCRLEQQDATTLLRLAFLARRCCRNRAEHLRAMRKVCDCRAAEKN